HAGHAAARSGGGQGRPLRRTGGDTGPTGGHRATAGRGVAAHRRRPDQGRRVAGQDAVGRLELTGPEPGATGRGGQRGGQERDRQGGASVHSHSSRGASPRPSRRFLPYRPFGQITKHFLYLSTGGGHGTVDRRPENDLWRDSWPPTPRLRRTATAPPASASSPPPATASPSTAPGARRWKTWPPRPGSPGRRST